MPGAESTFRVATKDGVGEVLAVYESGWDFFESVCDDFMLTSFQAEDYCLERGISIRELFYLEWGLIELFNGMNVAYPMSCKWITRI